MIYLYVKTHNKTGLKYLGKTVQDPFKYKGSGKHWMRHIKKYGYDVTTEIVFQCDDKQIFKEYSENYSKLHDIVKSKDWANIVEELGDGGDTSQSPKYNQAKMNGKFNGHIFKTEEQLERANQKRSLSLLGHKVSQETRDKISKTRKEKASKGILGTKKGKKYGSKHKQKDTV